MSDLRQKLKALQQAKGIRPGRQKSEREKPEEAPSCPDVAPLTSRIDTPAAARYRRGEAIRCKRMHLGEASEYRFREAAAEALASDLLDALRGECRLTIDIHRIDED